MDRKIGVVCLIFKKMGSEINIMTQWRVIRNPEYDPLYSKTWELIGELHEGNESVVNAILRGCREEFGIPDFKPLRIIGANEKVWSSNRGDAIRCHTPFCYIESFGVPQSWTNPVFAVEVPTDWSPPYEEADGEATKCYWWKPEELLSAIESEPLKFMTFHIPAMVLFCNLVLEGKIS